MECAQTDRPRLALGLLLLTAAVPWRYFGNFPLVSSVSVLDGAILVAGIVLTARQAMVHGDDGGDFRLTAVIAVLPLLCVASLMWTTDTSATVRTIVSYAEAFVAFRFAVQQTRGLGADRIMRMLRRFLYVLLVPPVLMLLQLPGFEPQQFGLSPTSGDYASYFSRLSHPFLGRSNNLATILLLLSVVLVHWALTHRGVATYAAALLCVTAIFLTISRGAILALLVSILLVVLLPHRPAGTGGGSRLMLVVGSGGLVAGLIAASYLANPTTQQFLGGRLDTSNFSGRELRFSAGVDYLLQRPFLGWGAGTVPGGDATIDGGVHNTYLQQLLAYGVVLGFVGVLSLVGLAVHLLRDRPGTLRRAVGLTMAALLVDLTVESSFEGAAMRVIIYLLLGILIGLARAEDVRPEGPQAQTVNDPAASSTARQESVVVKR
jgi:O-antigen ligase